MKRKIIQQLKLWKDNPARKPLILLGARQVGKTWVMKHFGLTEFENVAYINCDVEPLAKELFAADYNIPRILLALQAITGTKIEAGKTLIVFDELQEVERGLHSLKYFQENAPEYHVMAAGSLLGITLGKGQSFPVGKVNVMHLYPMDFEEFLMAAGETDLCDLLHQPDWEILKILSLKYIDLLRQYYYVGGMPEVVDCFFQHQNLQEVRDKQTEILDAYRRDISKHTTPTESMRIGQVLQSLPSQLAKENKKFIYNVLKKGARSTEYELANKFNTRCLCPKCNLEFKYNEVTGYSIDSTKKMEFGILSALWQYIDIKLCYSDSIDNLFIDKDSRNLFIKFLFDKYSIRLNESDLLVRYKSKNINKVGDLVSYIKSLKIE